MNLSLISSKRITLFKSIGFIFLASLFLSFAGCSTHRDFTYEPQSIEEAPQSVLKIAVMPFQENRKTRSDGSLDIANLPFVPSASKVEDAPQEITVRESGEYYYPDLLAYALTLDLIHNKVGSIVHLDPVVTEHYDIVIRGTLDGVPLTTERLSYGLGAASGVLRIVGVPSGSNTLEVIATYDMSEPGKTPSLYREQLKGEYSQTQWNGTEKIWGQQDNPVVLPGNAAPYIHGLLEAFHDITEEFITKSASQVEQLAAGLSDRESRFRYYRSLDPTLVRLESAIQRSSGSRKSNYLTEYKRRLVFLEKYRNKEWNKLLVQQKFRNDSMAARLSEAASNREKQRELQSAQANAERERRLARRRQYAAALTAGLLPAYTALSSQGLSNAGAAQMIAKDLSSSISAVPNNAGEVPNTKDIIDSVRTDLEGIDGIGTDPFERVDGASVMEMREKFLKLYRRVIKPV